MQAAVVHGYFPAVSKDEDLIVLDPDSGNERCRFTFPRQRRDRRLCLSDFWRPQESGETDVVAFQVVTMGSQVSEVAAALYAENAYRDYLELHGLSVQLTEALAEFWHSRVRAELGFADEDAADLAGILKLAAPRRPLRLGLPRLPRRRGPGQGGRAAAVGAGRHRAVRGVPAHAGAVDVGDHRPPPRGQVLRRRAEWTC